MTQEQNPNPNIDLDSAPDIAYGKAIKAGKTHEEAEAIRQQTAEEIEKNYLQQPAKRVYIVIHFVINECPNLSENSPALSG